MTKDKGIVMLATKHPYYGRMAYNLAVSIKSTETQIPVVVLHSGRGLQHLSEIQKEIFDEIIEIPQEGFAAKLWVYKHSPFKETLYIDADNAWMPKKKPEELFNEMAGSKFQAIVEGYIDVDSGQSSLHTRYVVWADLDQMKRAYQLKGTLYQYRSEAMYFKKDAQVGKMFSLAQKIQQSPKVEVTMFGGEVPDEFALNIAGNLTGIIPDRTDWQPSYWFNITKKMQPLPILAQQYYLLSSGGNTVSPAVKKMYNTIMAAAFYKMRMQNLFTLQPKRNSIPERNLM